MHISTKVMAGLVGLLFLLAGPVSAETKKSLAVSDPQATSRAITAASKLQKTGAMKVLPKLAANKKNFAGLVNKDKAAATKAEEARAQAKKANSWL